MARRKDNAPKAPEAAPEAPKAPEAPEVAPKAPEAPEVAPKAPEAPAIPTVNKFRIAEGKSLTSRKGILAEGDEVKPEYFGEGDAGLKVFNHWGELGFIELEK